MKIFFKPDDRFCDDSTPHWLQFGVFVLANIILIYTLYTRQPERYRGFSEWFSLTPKPVHDVGVIQAARAGWMMNIAQKAMAISKGQPSVTQAVAPAPANVEFLGMTLTDAVESKSKKRTSPDGVQVVAARRDGLGYLSGFRKDDVIVAFNTIPVFRVEEIKQLAASRDPARGMLFDVWRKGQRLYLTVEPANPLR